ncbi:ATP-binding protein [Stenotrophomonas maltophilia]|uniref:ATP-binding protein n=1 Tax=Stenotrophomonas maltophilia TaxID=40324 RepID=UPI001660C51C|nr:ATP-binding protein [Stenotrophomonas maltophilia]MBN4958945.1 HAMP domain-containing protein [Stenotrophomonas maltophilia]MBN4967929.1 HAMP domain-containing protein [Stenotrophomonas maltophilia]
MARVRRSGLSRHIIVSMSLMVIGVIVMMILSSWLLYAVLVEFFPGSTEEPESWLPTGPELAWMVGVILTGLALAIAASFRLAHRILSPLNSLVDSVRALASGDLGARASVEENSPGEVATLVEDFNAMARRLQHMESERAMWHAAIAHELRTPVTILRGRLQGLAEGVFHPDESQFRSLLAQVEGLSRLIEDLRVLSLSDNARLDVRRARTDVVAEVHSVMTLVDPQFRAAGFVLELETSREEHNAHCDPTRLRQALLALLENARRYASPGKVRIAVHDTPGHVQVAIEDEGPGIDPGLHVDIFTPFMRADGSRSRQGGGSGLGLAVVKAIADAHGGHAYCTPGSCGGSRFVIELPRQ